YLGVESLRLGVALADDQAAEPCLDDGVRIAASRIAVPLQNVQLVADHGLVAKDVRHVRVLRHQLERALLATAADHDRRAVRLDGLRKVERAMNLVVASLEGRRLLTEHGPADLPCLLGPADEVRGAPQTDAVTA